MDKWSGGTMPLFTHQSNNPFIPLQDFIIEPSAIKIGE